ncbi:hypothetical protein NA56DRAFT_703559 [Hyaloscypha hepaticicola]|uniref:Uncharacterized protein n=1 Tax=Hyaloscypha hepaticicola TaxID=2082293 RepID=A0A2J6Q518_9HELO|nr:hypothetical protein NA56DRAFT_703559 [Hyaloscypha hepaticicola]
MLPTTALRTCYIGEGYEPMLERTELALPHTPQAAHVGEGYCQPRTRFADDDDVALQILLLMMDNLVNRLLSAGLAASTERSYHIWSGFKNLVIGPTHVHTIILSAGSLSSVFRGPKGSQSSALHTQETYDVFHQNGVGFLHNKRLLLLSKRAIASGFKPAGPALRCL